MKKTAKLQVAIMAIALISALILMTRAETPPENMKMFYNGDFVGLGIQVNATAETKPNENITVTLQLKAQNYVDTVELKHFNLSIYGFLNGTQKTLITSKASAIPTLYQTPQTYSFNFTVPEHIWDTTYAEMTFTHTSKKGIFSVDNPGVTCGFYMTHVENIYFKDLTQKFSDLNDKYSQLNQTYWDLQKNYTSFQNVAGELDGTRRLATILGITTAFFVITTIFLLTRKPKDYW